MSRRRLLTAIATILCTLAGGPVTASAASGATVSSGTGSSVSVFAVGTAAAGARITFVDIPVRATGTLSVVFQGDPPNGCVAGACSLSGAVSWSPAPAGELFVIATRLHHRTTYQAELNFEPGFGYPFGEPGYTTARVNWTPIAGGSGGSTCADAVAGDQALTPVVRGTRLLLSLPQGPDLLETRCGGPLASDLTAAVPQLSLPIRQILRGQRTLDLSTTGSFAAHGFSGSVSSTITLALGRPQDQGQVPSTVSTTTRRYREVDLRVRAHLGGVAPIQLAGDADQGSCEPLGACGLSGSETVSPDVTQTADLIATAPVTRPARDLLAALGLVRTGSTRGIGAFNLMDWQSGGTLQANLQEGALTCTDTAPLGPGEILFQREGARLDVAYGESGDLGVGSSLRTRCPGPFGPQGALATGSIPLRDLARHTITIRLTRGLSYIDDGYTATARPDLTLTLTRIRVISRTVQQIESSSSSSL